jgi:hypothetical protein
MADQIERRFPGHDAREIFDRLLDRLGDVAARHSLKVESDPGSLSGRVHRTGADVRFRIAGDTLHVDLDFSFFVPGMIRQRVKDELSQRFEGLFA